MSKGAGAAHAPAGHGAGTKSAPASATLTCTPELDSNRTLSLRISTPTKWFGCSRYTDTAHVGLPSRESRLKIPSVPQEPSPQHTDPHPEPSSNALDMTNDVTLGALRADDTEDEYVVQSQSTQCLFSCLEQLRLRESELLNLHWRHYVRLMAT